VVALKDGSVMGADKVSGTDVGHIGGKKPFSVPDTFSVNDYQLSNLQDITVEELP
jgi:hypothetical protein